MKKPIRSNRLYTFLLFDGLLLKEETKAYYSSRNVESFKLTSGHGFFQFDFFGFAAKSGRWSYQRKRIDMVFSKRSGLEVEKVGFWALCRVGKANTYFPFVLVHFQRRQPLTSQPEISKEAKATYPPNSTTSPAKHYVPTPTRTGRGAATDQARDSLQQKKPRYRI